MTDFLDQLEDELRGAAERRGQPRRRRPTGSLKALVAVAAAALIVAGGARLANRDGAEQAAAPTPTPTMPGRTDIVYATTGDPALLNLLSARQRGFTWSEIPDDPPSTADPSLGTTVLYRPAGEERARGIAFGEKIDEVRPLTRADEQRIHFDVSRANVVVVYGREREKRMLGDPEICAPAGGALKLCVDRADEQRYSVFVLADRPLGVAPLGERGWWSWAALSPDRGAILAQWTGYDCESSRAALIADGHAQPLTDRSSEALGWTTDGRAIVTGGCDGEPGTFLLARDGQRERVTAGRLEPSLQPRSPEDLGRSP